MTPQPGSNGSDAGIGPIPLLLPLRLLRLLRFGPLDIPIDGPCSGLPYYGLLGGLSPLSRCASPLVWCTTPGRCAGGAYTVASRIGLVPVLTILCSNPSGTIATSPVTNGYSTPSSTARPSPSMLTSIWSPPRWTSAPMSSPRHLSGQPRLGLERTSAQLVLPGSRSLRTGSWWLNALLKATGHRHHRDMTDTPESRTESETAPPRVDEPRRYRDDRYDRPNRLNQVLAWVGIIAGVVFVVAVIFFSGFWMGRVSGHHYGWHRGYYNCGQMGTARREPAQMGPGGMMPGGMTTTPTTPRP